MTVTRVKGGDFMFSKLDAKLKDHNLKIPKHDEPLDIEGAETYLEDLAGKGKKLGEGLKRASSALEELANCGFTPEALRVLVHAKCVRKNGMGSVPTPLVVQAVLEALFRLDEYLR